MTKERDPEYLGDGVYASFDGWYIWLRTGAHEGPHVTNKIALEAPVFDALLKYHARLVKIAEAAEVHAEPWDYEGYWNAVLGADRDADRVVAEFELVAEGLDEWLGTAEAEAWNAGGGKQADLPEEWKGFHTRALAELTEAAENGAAPAASGNVEKQTYTLIEYMPAHLRASHEAAGNSGVYPHNGSRRIYVEGTWSTGDLDPRWCEVLEDQITELPEGETAASEMPREALAPYADPDDREP